MGYARKPVKSGRGAKVSSCPSVRRHVTLAITVASAGILTLGVVTATPDVHDARSEVRAVRLAASALHPVTPPRQILVEIVGIQPHTAPPVALMRRSTADYTAVTTPTERVTIPLKVESAIDGVPKSQTVGADPLAATAVIPGLFEILGPFINNPIVGPIVLFGTIIAVVILACPPCALFNFLTFSIPSLFIPFAPLSAVAAVSTATVDASSTIAPDTSPPSTDSAPATMTTAGPPDAVAAGETRKADIALPSTSTNPETESDQMSTDATTSTTEVAEAAELEASSTEPTTASAPEPSASGSTSEPARPAGRTETPRPVRDSLRFGDLPHVRGSQSTTGTGTAADDAATAGSPAAESLAAASSSTASNTAGDDSSGGDAADS
jgi:hypothetical protein